MVSAPKRRTASQGKTRSSSRPSRPNSRRRPGTTSARIVTLLRDAGATEVHVRVSAPPFISPCYYGTDIDSKENLIACQMTIPEICSYIGADSLGYLSLKGVKSLTSPDLQEEDWFCTGCFDGTYPIAVPKEMPKDKFESKIGE